MDIAAEQRRLAAELVANLEALGKDRAAMARLKRCAGRPLAECTELFALFYRLVPGAARGKDWLEGPCFLIATLFPFAPERSTGDLGRSLHQFAQQMHEHTAGVERRVGVLLDCAPEGLPFRLRQAVTFLAGRGIGIDWRQLLVDVLQWDWSNRPAQKRWARSFFGDEVPGSEPAAVATSLQRAASEAGAESAV